MISDLKIRVNELKAQLEYCGFIKIRWIPIFVDFVCTGEPRIYMFNEIQIFLRNVCRIYQNNELKYPRICKFSSIHENWYPRK